MRLKRTADEDSPFQESPLITLQAKRLEDNRQVLKEMQKLVTRHQKAVAAELEEMQPILRAGARAVEVFDVNDEPHQLRRAYQLSVDFQRTFSSSSANLQKFISTCVVHQMQSFVKGDIRVAQQQKRTYDKVRQNFHLAVDVHKTAEKAMKKASKSQQEHARQKFEHALTARDQAKQDFELCGDETLNQLTITLDNHAATFIDTMCDYLVAYHEHIQKGVQFFEKTMNEILELKKNAEERRTQVDKDITAAAVPTEQTKVFGTPLDVLAVREPENALPSVYGGLLLAIEDHLNVEGIFRVSPPKSDMEAVRRKLDRGVAVDYSSVDVHVLTCLIKGLVRELPEPLLTYDLYQEFVDVDDIESESEKVSTLSGLVSRLPTPNRNVMAAICTSSARVAEQKESNKMDLGNLAIIYGPSILISPNPNAATMITDMEAINNVCKFMFEHYGEIGLVFDLVKGGGGSTGRPPLAGSLSPRSTHTPSNAPQRPGFVLPPVNRPPANSSASIRPPPGIISPRGSVPVAMRQSAPAHVTPHSGESEEDAYHEENEQGVWGEGEDDVRGDDDWDNGGGESWEGEGECEGEYDEGEYGEGEYGEGESEHGDEPDPGPSSRGPPPGASPMGMGMMAELKGALARGSSASSLSSASISPPAPRRGSFQPGPPPAASQALVSPRTGAPRPVKDLPPVPPAKEETKRPPSRVPPSRGPPTRPPLGRAQSVDPSLLGGAPGPHRAAGGAAGAAPSPLSDSGGATPSPLSGSGGDGTGGVGGGGGRANRGQRGGGGVGGGPMPGMRGAHMHPGRGGMPPRGAPGGPMRGMRGAGPGRRGGGPGGGGRGGGMRGGAGGMRGAPPGGGGIPHRGGGGGGGMMMQHRGGAGGPPRGMMIHRGGGGSASAGGTDLASSAVDGGDM